MFEIRVIDIEDSAIAAKLMTQLGYPSTEAELRQRITRFLSDSKRTIYVAELDSQVVGLVAIDVNPYLEKNGDYGRILAMVVDDAARGMKVGQRLIEKCETWFAEHSAIEVLVNSNVKRLDAHRFYERLGYGKTGFRFVKKLF